MMDQNKLTIASQEAIQAAQTKAIRFGHMEVDGEHLLLALLEQADGLIPRLLKRMEVPVDAAPATASNRNWRKRPRVSGPGVEPGKVYLTQRLNKLLRQGSGRGAAAERRIHFNGAPVPCLYR